jgi:thiol-disulfide isomerase/thioredoxin
MALTAIGCLPAEPPAQSTTEPAVKLQLLDFAGIEHLIASHRGKVVVMDAWNTSCPPCIKEFPNLVALSKQYGPDKLACISLSFDYEGIGQPKDVEPGVLAFLRQQRATFDNVLSTDASDALYRRFKFTSVPAVFVYDRDGNLVKRFDNEDAATEADAFTYEQVSAFVADLLN